MQYNYTGIFDEVTFYWNRYTVTGGRFTWLGQWLSYSQWLIYHPND